MPGSDFLYNEWHYNGLMTDWGLIAPPVGSQHRGHNIAVMLGKNLILIRCKYKANFSFVQVLRPESAKNNTPHPDSPSRYRPKRLSAHHDIFTNRPINSLPSWRDSWLTSTRRLTRQDTDIHGRFSRAFPSLCSLRYALSRK